MAISSRRSVLSAVFAVGLLLGGCKGGAKSCSLDRFVDTLIANPGYESSLIGDEGRPSDKFRMLDSLCKCSTSEQWEPLTRNPNATIRVYAFWALSRVSSPNLLKLALEHLHDTDTITTLRGCFIEHEFVGDYIYELLSSRSVDAGLLQQGKADHLDSGEIFVLDSALIASHSRLSSRSTALDEIPARPSVHSLIQRVVAEHRDPRDSSFGVGLVSLARYRSPEDIGQILSFLAYADSLEIPFPLGVYDTFPRPEFQPALEKRLRGFIAANQWSWDFQALFHAMMKYGSASAIPLFHEAFAMPDGDVRAGCMNGMYRAMAESGDKAYDALTWEIWDRDGILPLDDEASSHLQVFATMKRLEALDSVRAAKLYAKDLRDRPHLLLNPAMDDSANALRVVHLRHMFALAEKASPGFTEAWLARGIEQTKDFEYNIFRLVLPEHLGSRSIQKAMLRQISSTTEPEVFITFTRTLALEGSPRVLSEIDHAMRRNVDQDTSDYADEIRVFLRDSVGVGVKTLG